MSNCDKVSEIFMALYGFDAPNENPTSASFNSYLSSEEISIGEKEFIIRFLTLIDLCVQEAKDSSMSLAQSNILVERIRKYQIDVLVKSGKQKWGEFSGDWMKVAGDDFSLYAATIGAYTVDKFDSDYVDKISKDVARKIAEIKKTKLPEHVKSSIIISLSSIGRICSEYSVFGERDIKNRIKAVMSDLQLQYQALEKADQKRIAAVFDWISKSILGGGGRVLNIGASAATIAGYIEGPKP